MKTIAWQTLQSHPSKVARHSISPCGFQRPILQVVEIYMNALLPFLLLISISVLLKSGVGIESWYIDEGMGCLVWGLIPSRGRRFFYCHKHPSWLWAPLILLLSGCWCSFPGGKVARAWRSWQPTSICSSASPLQINLWDASH